MSTMESLFGELRGLLAHGNLEDDARKAALVAMLTRALEQDPQGYGERVVPYLSGLRLEWPQPFLECTSLEELERQRALLPMAKLALSADLCEQEALWALLQAPGSQDLTRITLHAGTAARYAPLAPAYLEPLLATPRPSLRALCFQKVELAEEGIRLLLTSTAWPNLTTLALPGVSLSPVVVRALCEAPFFAQLTSLELSQARTFHNPDGLNAIFEQGPLALGALNLSGVSLPDHFLHTLSQSSSFGHLRELSLRRSRAHASDIDALLTSPTLPGFERLDLSWCGLGPGSLSQLHKARALEPLRELSLGINSVDDASIQSLAQCSWCEQLEALHLNHLNEDYVQHPPHRPDPNMPAPEHTAQLLERLNPERIRHLSLRAGELNARAVGALTRFGQLESLSIAYSHIEPELYARLLATPFPHIKKLNLRSTNLTVPLLERLLSSCTHSHLRELLLDDNPLGTRAIPALFAPAHLPALTHLHMQLADLGDGAAARLLSLKKEHLKTLRKVVVYHNRFSDRAIRALEHHPSGKICAHSPMVG